MYKMYRENHGARAQAGVEVKTVFIKHERFHCCLLACFCLQFDQRQRKTWHRGLQQRPVGWSCDKQPRQNQSEGLFASKICKRLKKTTEGFLKSSTYLRWNFKPHQDAVSETRVWLLLQNEPDDWTNTVFAKQAEVHQQIRLMVSERDLKGRHGERHTPAAIGSQL